MGCVPIRRHRDRDAYYRTSYVSSKDTNTDASDDDSEDGVVVPERFLHAAGRVIERFGGSSRRLGYVEFNTMLAALELPLNDPAEFGRACEANGGTSEEGVSCEHLAVLLRKSRDVYSRVIDLMCKGDQPSRTFKPTDGSAPPMCPVCTSQEPMVFCPHYQQEECWECAICEAYSLASSWSCTTPGCVTHYCILCCPNNTVHHRVHASDPKKPRESREIQIRWHNSNIMMGRAST
eukprot:TRINITY_DN45665_c0_g1_i1.p1 TRINITY_DN45665_c0_g1~~TRINITY_DN45665_c0_g1_i1.p1  ORF type:complete len:254 (+),score=35.25 TRINITY_DN45665_c0_g1_i1:58-762(+)